MTQTTAESLSLAGFALAQAVWAICDSGRTGPMVPFTIVKTGPSLSIHDYEAPPSVSQVAQEFAASDGWAFARENGVVVAIDFWTPDMTHPDGLVQRFSRTSNPARARMHGVPSMIIDGVQRDDDEGALMAERVETGVREHPHAERLWRYWVDT